MSDQPRYEIIGGLERTAPPTWVETAQLVAAELAPSMAGALIGAALGNAPGAAAGGAGGSAIGNMWAQNLRREMGLSDEIAPGELFAATATGAIPLGKFAKAGVMAKTAIRGAQGSAMAGGDVAIRTFFDEKRLPTEQEWKSALLFGGIMGGTLGAAEAKFFRDTGLPAEEGMTRKDIQHKLVDHTDKVLLLENKEAKRLKGDIIYGEGETTLYEKPVDQSVQRQHPSYIEESLTPEQIERWSKGKLTEEDKLNAMDAVIVTLEDASVKALEQVPTDALPRNIISQSELRTASWFQEANQPKVEPDIIGTKPARITPDTITDLKAAMTGGTQEMPELEDLRLIRSGINAIDEAQRKGGGAAGALVKGQKQKRRDLLAAEKQIHSQLPEDMGLAQGYTDQYKKVIELEDAIDQVETLAQSAPKSERGKYIAAARKMKRELHEARTQLTKEEQMAQDIMPANKFAQYVASGGLMAGLPVAYFQDDDDEYSLASGFSIAAGVTGLLMAIALGKSSKNISRALRDQAKGLRMPKTKQVKVKGQTKTRVPVEDQPLDYSEGVVRNADTSPYQHSNWKTLRSHATKLAEHVGGTLSRRLKILDRKLNTYFQDAESKINTMKRDMKIQSLFMYAMEDAAKKGGFMDEFRRAWGMEGTESAQAIAKLFDANKQAVTASARILAKKQGIKDADGITLGFGDGSGDYTYSMYRKAMDTLFDELGESGMDVGYRAGYNPRLVKDYNQFRTYLEQRGANYKPVLDAALEGYAKKHNKTVADLSAHEEAQVLSRLFAQMRGNEGKPGFAQQRVFTKIDDEMMDAYEDPGRALSSYISQASEKSVARKFLGKGLGKGEFDTGIQNIDESLAGRMAQAIGKEHGIETPEQLAELQEIIQKRFNSAPVDPLVQLWRNSNYFTTIANVGTTITQLMDLVNTFYFAGAGNTFRTMLNRGKKDWFNEMGLDHQNSVDFGATGGGLNTFLDWMLNTTKFNQLDKWAKNVSLEALYKKYKGKATQDAGALMEELTGEFGAPRAKEIVKKLQDWDGAIDGSTPTPPEIQHLLFAKAADFLPLSRLEMPGAAEGKFAPLFYQLKTYTIKQLDIYREINQGGIQKAVRLLADKKPKEAAEVALPALKGLAGYGAMLAMAGATTDTIKDMMYGRPTELDDTVKNNLFRLALINRYHVYKAERDGLGKAFLDYIMPATTTVDRLSKDVSAFAAGEDFKGHALQGTILDPIYWGMEGMGGYEKTHR